jgi:hypothetical protein
LFCCVVLGCVVLGFVLIIPSPMYRHQHILGSVGRMILTASN